jgi:transcriptional regulator with XRE-family HTH domain
MGAQEFGALIEAERLKRGWTRSKLAVMVGVLDDGSALDATQIRRIVEGIRKLTHELVQRLIAALDLPEEEAWHAAGLWPPDLTIEDYRRYRHRLAVVGAPSDQHNPNTGRSGRWPGQRRGPDRRRRDRRSLHLVPELVAA